MNPEEKWKRICNPTTVEDYGLSMSLGELKSFPEGSAVAAYIESHSQLLQESSDLVASALESVHEKAFRKTYGECIILPIPPKQ